jgi:hypothetical protein
MYRIWRNGVMVCALFVAGALIGCSSSDNTVTSPTNTGVNGNVNKAPVAGATVNLHTLNANGTVGAVVSGPFTTDASGNWTGTFPNSQSGPKVLVVTGGSYVDEASGLTTTILPGKQLRGVLTGTSSQVTPLTEATFLGVQSRVAGGGTLANVITEAATSATTAFGFDPATTVPSTAAGATLNQKKYAALLGGLSTMLHANAALGAFANTQRIDLALAAAKDISDGKLDGLDVGGSVIEVPIDSAGTGLAQLPALSATNLSAWMDSSNTYAAGTPSLAGIAFDANTVWIPGGTASSNANVTFTGTGTALLPSTQFTTTTSAILTGSQVVWNDDPHHVQILVVLYDGHPGLAQTLTVTFAGDPGAVWTKFEATGLAGVTIGADVTTLSNAIVDEISGGSTSLTLNGTLTNPTPTTQRAAVAPPASSRIVSSSITSPGGP